MGKTQYIFSFSNHSVEKILKTPFKSVICQQIILSMDRFVNTFKNMKTSDGASIKIRAAYPEPQMGSFGGEDLFYWILADISRQ